MGPHISIRTPHICLPAMTTPTSRHGSYERLMAAGRSHPERVDQALLRSQRSADLAILTCMDTRIVVEDIFELRTGDAIVLRNAGAVATDDVLRSLILAQQLLGTGEVIVVGHSGCGLSRLAEDALRRSLEGQTGASSEIAFGSFADVDGHVQRQVELIRDHPWIKPVGVHGLVYEVETGAVREVG